MDVMVDIETLGTSSRSVMLEIAAVAFDPLGALLGPLDHNSKDIFYKPIDPQSCLSLGFEVDWDTIRFWFGQERCRHFAGDWVTVHIGQALDQFGTWMAGRNMEHLWGHGATFDPVILAEYYRRTRKVPPFKYKQVRDTRTLFDMCPKITEEAWNKITEREIKHHPLHDAWAQARAVQFVTQQGMEKDETTGNDNPTGTGSVPGTSSSPARDPGTYR